MKKSFSYNLTQFGAAGNTVTEHIKTSEGVKTITTDANTGAVILADSVDEDSLNPVTGAAVATAIAQGGGGVPDVTNPLYIDTDDAVALRFGSGLSLEGISEDDTLAVALSGTGGLFYDEMDSNGLAVQLDHDGGLENVIDDGVQVGLKVKTDGTTIDINASGELEAIGGGSVVTDSNAPFNGSGTQASPLGFNIDSDSLNVSASSIGPIAYADASFTGNSEIGTLLDTSGTVTMQFTGLSWPGNPGDSAYIVLTYGSNNSIASRTSGRIANDHSVTLTIDVHNADTRYGTWTADSTLYTIKIWDIQESSYAPYTNVTIVDSTKRLRINRPVPAAQSADNGKVLSVTDSSGSIGWVSIMGGQTLGYASVTGYNPASTLSVTCDTSKSALYNLVCIVPYLIIDLNNYDATKEYYLELAVSDGQSTGTYNIPLKCYSPDRMFWHSSSSTVAYIRRNSISSVSIVALKEADGTAVTGDWIFLNSNLYVYGLA